MEFIQYHPFKVFAQVSISYPYINILHSENNSEICNDWIQLN